MNVDLRPYQTRAVERVNKAYQADKKSALIVLPTGLGKTCCMAAVAEEEVKKGGRVLFLAHRTELLRQAAEEIESMTGIDTGYISGKDVPDTPILLSSIQGMSKDHRLNSFKPEDFSMVMIDEAHHMFAGSYDKIIDHFKDARLLGVTATPRRGDDRDVSEKFKEVCSEYTLCEAINEDWLAPIVLQNCPVKIDISKTHVMAGDYSTKDIGEALLPYMDAIADQVIEKASDRKVLIFVPLVATAKGLAEIFQKKGAKADYVSGKRKAPEIISRFKNGEINILINSLLLTEGFNEPTIDCIVNLRATQSEALLRQIIGRGTRKAPGKENLLILDFFWKNKKNRSTLSVSDIISLEMGVDERDIFEVNRRCKNLKGGPANIMDLITSIGGDVQEEREAALLRAIKKAEEEEERRRKFEEIRQQYLKDHPDLVQIIRNDPKYELKRLVKSGNAFQITKHCYLVDNPNGNSFVYTDIPVFRALGIDSYEVRFICDSSMFHIDDDAPTEKQRCCLVNFGIDPEYFDESDLRSETCFISKGYSGFIIGTLIDRQKRGMCSYKQAKLLCKKGAKDLKNLHFSAASGAINQLSANNWQPTKRFWDIIETDLSRSENRGFEIF